MTDLVDAPPHVRPLERYVQLETDHFCDCGYNLHGQVVTRDERLNFMVCRCPECGRFHPAGQGVAARSLWLGRFATSMLVAWLLGLVVFFLVMGFLLATWPTIFVMENTRMVNVTDDGDEVSQVYDPNTGAVTYSRVSDGIVVGQQFVRWRRVPQPLAQMWARNWQEGILLLLVAEATAFLTGVVAAVATWHTRKRFLPLWLIYPFVCVALAWLFVIFVEQRSNPGLMGWSIPRFALAAAIQCVGLAVGLYFGRPLVRLLAKIFIPPNARQAMAFLWYADGKMPPPVRA